MAQLAGGVRREVESWKDRALRLYRAARARWGWFDHLGRAYERYDQQKGDRLAAALTFYGFLSFFPLVALAFAITGYAVAVDPNARDYVTRAISQLVPGLTGELKVDQIARAKAGAGILGLAGLLWAGLGWIGVWRESLRTIWMVNPAGGGNFVVKKLWDLGIIFALGAALITSVAISSLTTSATHRVLGWIGLADVPGAGTVLRLISLAVAIGFNTVIFLVLFSRLSGTQASWRRILRGAVFGAVGFEVLKLAGTYLIGHTTRNPVYASFAVIVGLLVWIYLASRFVLFTASWTATRKAILRADADNPEAVEHTAPIDPVRPPTSDRPKR